MIICSPDDETLAAAIPAATCKRALLSFRLALPCRQTPWCFLEQKLKLHAMMPEAVWRMQMEFWSAIRRSARRALRAYLIKSAAKPRGRFAVRVRDKKVHK